MPLDYGPSMPSAGMPPDLMEAAQDADAMIGSELAALVPAFDKPINTKVMNALAKAIADVGRVMGMDIVPDTYSEPVMELEPDVVRFLAMASAAAEDYGKPLPIELDQLRTEADLTTLTAALIQLAKDSKFEEFLDMPAEGEEADVSVSVEVMPEEEEEAEAFDFASRMRR